MKKFIQISKLKRLFIILFLLFFYILISAFFYVDAVSSDISNSVFRLHVIANSDSKEDQELKYKVRDKVLEYMNLISKNCTSKEDVINLAKTHQEEFKNIAQNVIKENGYNYNVNIYIGKYDFPTKTYGDISFPAGNYDCLRIEIGESQGQNWWCVMFPPLCFVDVTSGIVPEDSKSLMQNNLTDEEYSIISDNHSPDIQIKFGLIEMFNNFKNSSNLIFFFSFNI